MANILQGGSRDTINSDSSGAAPTWAVTNLAEDFTIDCNGLVTEIGDGLGTLIKDLIRRGVIDGTTA